MSYIFSQALVEEYLGASCSESAPFAPLSLNPTPQAYCSPDRMTAYSRLSRFGMTCAPLTDDRGAALLTWYLEASRARISARQEKEPVLMGSVPASGGKCTVLLARYDLNTSLWRTPQCSLLAGLDVFLGTWPRSGMMRNGWCWERTTWGPRTSENASGYLHMIPTPTACNAPNKGSHSRGPKSLLDVATTGWMPGMMWPPATTKDLDRGSNARKASLKRGVWIGTPTASGKNRSKKFREGNKLPNPYEFVEMFPTPTSRDWKDSGSSQGNRKSPNLGTIASRFPTPRTKGMCGGDREFSATEIPGNSRHHQQRGTQANDCGEWWSAEPDVGRVAHGVAARVDRLKAIGNGQVPAVAATAFLILFSRFQNGKEFNL